MDDVFLLCININKKTLRDNLLPSKHLSRWSNNIIYPCISMMFTRLLMGLHSYFNQNKTEVVQFSAILHATNIDSKISNITLQIIRVMPILWRWQHVYLFRFRSMLEAEICWSAFYWQQQHGKHMLGQRMRGYWVQSNDNTWGSVHGKSYHCIDMYWSEPYKTKYHNISLCLG